MAAITSVLYTGETVPFPSATPGGLVAEIWTIGASAAGDTQTISVAGRLTKITAIIGGVSHLVAPLGTSAALITTGVVAASNFTELLIIGPAVP